MADTAWGSSLDGSRRLRLAANLGVVFAGAIVLALGTARVGADLFTAAGVSPAFAVELSLAVAALVPMVVFFALLLSIDAPHRHRRYVVLGTIVAAGSLVMGYRFTTMLGDRIAAFLYAIGLILGLIAVTGSFLAAAESDESSVRYERSGTTRRRPNDAVLPSDGGEEDDDLTFLMDDEK